MQEAAQKLQQTYTVTRRYNKTAADEDIDNAMLTTWGLDRSPASGTKRYDISFSAGPDASTYTLQAVPTGVQAKDDCGTFTLNQSNAKTANGKGVRDPQSIECWSR
ncbi:type IV pilin protein [Suttonella sp. R2A3]|nr:type IV pilin protein [Suttonella sp. R2A3]